MNAASVHAALRSSLSRRSAIRWEVQALLCESRALLGRAGTLRHSGTISSEACAGAATCLISYPSSVPKETSSRKAMHRHRGAQRAAALRTSFLCTQVLGQSGYWVELGAGSTDYRFELGTVELGTGVNGVLLEHPT